MIGALGIVSAFLVLAATLAWILVWGRGRWWLRGILGMAVIYASLVLWGSLREAAGWPADGPLPQSGVEVHGAVVSEPSGDDVDGAIYIWGTPLAGAGAPASRWVLTFLSPWRREPRSWRLTYTRQGHERAEAARKALAQGRPVLAKNGRPPTGGTELKGQHGSGEGEDGDDRRGGMSPRREDDDLRFYDLPPPRLPQKRRD